MATVDVPLIFRSWREVPEELRSRSRWLLAGQKIVKGVEALAFCEKTGLYDYDQTEPARFSKRTKAYQAFEEVFLNYSEKSSFIRWSEKLNDWYKPKPDPHYPHKKVRLDSQVIRSHINHAEIIGVRPATSITRFICVDLDCHNDTGDWTTFIKQFRILSSLLNRGTWHIDVGPHGVHFLRWFNEWRILGVEERKLRKMLADLDNEHPDLVELALGAGVPSFANLEIFPMLATRKDKEAKGFRLPLCRGRTLLLDRPVDTVVYRGKETGNIEAYMGWLANPERLHMDVEAVIRFVMGKVQRPGSAPLKVKPKIQTSEEKIIGKLPIWVEADGNEPVIVEKVVVKKVTTETTTYTRTTANRSSLAGSLKGQFRRVLVDFWRGINVTAKLNTVVLLSARVFRLEGVEQVQAAKILKTWCRSFPVDVAPAVSSRIATGNWEAIDKDVQRAVQEAYGDGAENRILELAVKRWSFIGFKLSDRSTWGKAWAGRGGPVNVEFSSAEIQEIQRVMGKALGKDAAQAVEVASGVLQLVSMKVGESETSKRLGADMAYPYWSFYLADRHGIQAENRNKVARILGALLELKLIIRTHGYIVGYKATRYVVGPRFMDRVNNE